MQVARRFNGLVIAVLLAPCAWPQAGAGSVSGTVRDQSSAVIPGTAVVLKNGATNVTSTTRTNETGFYLFPGVIAGPYLLTVEVSGMQKYEGAFTVQAVQGVVIDPVLKPGQTATTVEVKDVTPMVAVDSPTVQQWVDHARMEQLPINGRTLYPLARSQPGMEGNRAFGAPADASVWILDGVPVTGSKFGGSNEAQAPGLGAIQELTLVTNAVSAKYSRATNFIATTRSGTNQLHGTAYETARNNAFGVARSRTDVFTKAPHLVRNEFGVSAGGPVIIPKVYNGKDRTFWFVNYEAAPQAFVSTSTGDALWKVPTEAMRNGDFSGLVDSQGRLQVLYDPLTTDTRTGARQPFSYGGKLNVIDPNRISPTAKYLFSITPLPTNNLNPMIDFNWYGPPPFYYDYASAHIRIDHRFSDRDQVFIRYNDAKSSQRGLGANRTPSRNEVPALQTTHRPLRNGAVSWTRTFSPSFFSELTFGVRHQIDEAFTGSATTQKQDWFGKLGMPNPFGYMDWPEFPSLGLGNYALRGAGAEAGNEINYNLDHNLTKIRGKHEFQFGWHYRTNQVNSIQNDRLKSQFGFGTLATALYDAKNSTPTNPQATPQTGSDLANMYLGVGNYQSSLLRRYTYVRWGEQALYFQDNYKVTPRLTVNVGLRWERWGAIHEKNNLMVGFDRAKGAMVLGTDLDTMYKLGASLPSVVAHYQSLGLKFESYKDAGLPQDLAHNRNRNFGPRLGFAYRALEGKNSFVVRGGFSTSYFAALNWLTQGQFNDVTPLAATFTYNPYTDATQSPDGLGNYGLRSVPAVIMGVNSQNVLDLSQPRSITRGTAKATYFDPDRPDVSVKTWNLTIEKEVAASTVARVRYAGNHSSNLYEWYKYNEQTPDYIWYATTGQPKPTGEYANVGTRFYDRQVLGTVQQFRGSGWANVHGMDLELERRYNKGYAFQLSYVVSNALTTQVGVPTVPEVNQFMPGLVPTDYRDRMALLLYQRDTGIPKHSVKWNFLVDLPIGEGKMLAGNAARVLDKFIGGWQLAGLGTLRSTYFSLPTNNWNFTGVPIQQFGYQYPIQDCRGGSCIPGYLWWNGYIPPNQINSVDSKGNPNGYMGIPADYKPAVTPLIPWGSTALPANAPAGTNVSSLWDTNKVWVPLKNGTVQRVGYDNGLHPWRNQYLPSVRQWNFDASLFKNIPFSERVNLRFAADFFNVFNHPGNPNSVAGDGFLSTRASGNNPRVLQLSLRLTW